MWEVFHAAHITNLTEVIDTVLPDRYYALNQKSLQLSALNFETGEQSLSVTRPDIGIYGASTPPTEPGLQTIGSPTATLPLIKIMIEDEPLSSVLIYEMTASNDALPVTRIELLSPTNKPPGSHYRQYLRKRNETLENGINLIEIDYLHETKLPSDLIRSYPKHQPGAYPYLILVSEPNPPTDHQHTLLYGFHVDEVIAETRIPLKGNDEIKVNFGAVYDITFSNNRYYGMRLVDYEHLPLRFETYSDDDQKRIRERMASVKGRLS